MEQLETFIKAEILDLDPDYIATICGSYRRGAASSGDIDILLTHPEFTSKDEKQVPDQAFWYFNLNASINQTDAWWKNSLVSEISVFVATF